MNKEIYIANSVHTLEITSNAATSIGWDIQRGLSASIRDHYVNYPDAFGPQEQGSLDRMKLFFTLGNNLQIYQSVTDEFERQLKDAREKKKKSVTK